MSFVDSPIQKLLAIVYNFIAYSANAVSVIFHKWPLAVIWIESNGDKFEGYRISCLCRFRSVQTEKSSLQKKFDQEKKTDTNLLSCKKLNYSNLILYLAMAVVMMFIVVIAIITLENH